MAACLSITSLKNTETAWPKMMGSAIFIIVAFTCSENSTPSFFAASICSAKKARSALALITAASMISPAVNRRLRLQHGDGAVGAGQFDANVGRRRDGGRDFRAEVIAIRHVRDMRFGVRAPGGHLVRVFAGVLLDGAGGAAVGIALAQYRIDDAAEHLAIARLDVLLGVRRGVVRIVRNVVALALQFLDRGLELRDRGGDVGQLDDVGLGPQRELAEFGEFVVDPLCRGELLGESGEDAAGQRDVLQLHGHTRRAHEGFDDRQQGIGCERRGFIDLCPHDFEIWHACTSGRRACLGRPETEHWRARWNDFSRGPSNELFSARTSPTGNSTDGSSARAL